MCQTIPKNLSEPLNPSAVILVDPSFDTYGLTEDVYKVMPLGVFF